MFALRRLTWEAQAAMERSRWPACVAHATCCQKTNESRKKIRNAEAGKCCAFCGTQVDMHGHGAIMFRAGGSQGFPGAAATTSVLHELLGGGGHGQQPFFDLLDFSWRGQPLPNTYRAGFRLPLTLFSHSGVTKGRLHCGKQKK